MQPHLQLHSVIFCYLYLIVHHASVCSSYTKLYHKVIPNLVDSMGNDVDLKDESGKNTINLRELEQSLSCPLIPRLTSQS